MNISLLSKSICLAAMLAMTSSILTASAGTIIYGRAGDSASLDPADGKSTEDFKLTDSIFDSLVRYKGETTEIEPALAESWEASPDGKSWTFHLRKNVKFHDGTPFNSEAVIFSFERQNNPQSPYYSARFTRWAPKFGTLIKMEPIDEHTVRLDFSQPMPSLLKILPVYTANIVSPTAVQADKDGFASKPVGTGPFKFSRWEKNNFIELVRNDDYWEGPAKSERVVFRVIPENDVRLLALQKGEINVTDDVPFNRMDEVEKDDRLKLSSVRAFGFGGIYLNLEKGPLADVRVRRALAHALNRERMWKVVYFGKGRPANQPIRDGVAEHADDIQPYAYDPEKAKELLKEAGQESGLKLTLVSFNNARPYFPAPADAAAMIKADLAKVGVDVNIEMVTWAAWLERRRNPESYDMILGGWSSSIMDGDGILYPVFHSKFIGTDNMARWKNEEADALMEKARTTMDHETRLELYRETARIIASEVPVIFTAHPVLTIAFTSNVEGLYRKPSDQTALHGVSVK